MPFGTPWTKLVYDGLLCEIVKSLAQWCSLIQMQQGIQPMVFFLRSHRRSVFPAFLMNQARQGSPSGLEEHILCSYFWGGKKHAERSMRAPGHIQRCYCLVLYTSKDIQGASTTALPSQQNQSPPNIPISPITYKIFKGWITKSPTNKLQDKLPIWDFPQDCWDLPLLQALSSVLGVAAKRGMAKVLDWLLARRAQKRRSTPVVSSNWKTKSSVDLLKPKKGAQSGRVYHK